MNEKVENLVLEQLRAMRATSDRILDEIRAIKSEMTSIRHHVRGIEVLQDQDHGDIAAMKVRLDRVERRLELVDEQS
jgi:hypothetical protein